MIWFRLIGIGMLAGIFYYGYNHYYKEPMNELEHDRSVLKEQEIKYKKNVIKANIFEYDMSVQKQIMEDLNEELKVGHVDTNFSDGEHTLHL